MTGFELLEKMKENPRLAQIPVIVYTGKELSKKQETELRRLAETIIIKDVKSPDRLLDETALFLHRVESNLPAEKRKMLEQLHQHDPSLAGRKALVVDDDIRNIFALTSVLEQHDMEVFYAENGKDGIQMLQDTPGIDVVLMDVMMPEMDGYEAMRAGPRDPEIPDAADHRAHRQGDEGGPGEVHRGRRVRLHHQAGGHRTAGVAAAGMAVPVKPRPGKDTETIEALELDLLLEAVFRLYGYDFRDYARTSMRRRIANIMRHEEVRTISALQDKVLHDRGCLGTLPERDFGQRQRDVPRSRFLPRVPAARGPGASHLSVHPHLAGRVLARRGGLLAGDSARGGGPLRSLADLRDRHQRSRRCARPAMASIRRS